MRLEPFSSPGGLSRESFTEIVQNKLKRGAGKYPVILVEVRGMQQSTTGIDAAHPVK
jgi:hypothetical protein